jgi:hypothetical protein
VRDAATPLRLKELCRDLEHCCCAYGNIVLALTLTAPDAAYLRTATQAITQLGLGYPQGVGLITMVDGNTPPPSEVTRAAIQQLFRDIAGFTRGGIMVVEGQGFKASAKRSAITLINMTTRLPYPIKVAASVSEAEPLLMKMLGPAFDVRITAAGLADAAASMRASFVSALHA